MEMETREKEEAARRADAIPGEPRSASRGENTRATNYDKQPTMQVSGNEALCAEGWAEIARELKERVKRGGRTVVVAECYPGVDAGEVQAGLKELAAGGGTVIFAERALKPADELEKFLAPWLGDDPVFGRMRGWEMGALFDAARTAQLRGQIAQARGAVLVYGTGAAYVAERWDLLLYCDVTRWEIQQRQRAHRAGSIGAGNAAAAPAELYKRAYFLDWRAADTEKHRLHDALDFYIDTNRAQRPAMIAGVSYREALEKAGIPSMVVEVEDRLPADGQLRTRFEAFIEMI
jgi:hypothetical protein